MGYTVLGGLQLRGKAGNSPYILKAGTSTVRVVNDVADTNFLDLRLDNGALSGDNRGMYLRLYLTGAGGGGEAARIFTTVEDVAAGTAHGAHISLNFNNTGSITGLGVASRNTLHVPNAAMSGGTYAATQAEIYSDGASSDITGVTRASFIRIVNDGNATGIGKTDDKAFLFDLVGGSDATGNVFFGVTLKVGVQGTTKYMVLSTTENELALTGDARINMSACTILAGNTDGGLIKAGTSAAKVIEDTANMKFMSFYFDNGATGGSAEGLYLRLYATGSAQTAQALRAFTSVDNVAAANARGAHISLSFGTTGSITGLGAAMVATLHVPGAMTNGTYAAIGAEVWADAAGSSLAGAAAKSFIRVGVGGDATGLALLDAQLALFDFYGVTAASGKFIDTSKTTHTAYGGIPVNIPGVGIRWFALVSA